MDQWRNIKGKLKKNIPVMISVHLISMFLDSFGLFGTG